MGAKKTRVRQCHDVFTNPSILLLKTNFSSSVPSKRDYIFRDFVDDGSYLFIQPFLEKMPTA